MQLESFQVVGESEGRKKKNSLNKKMDWNIDGIKEFIYE